MNGSGMSVWRVWMGVSFPLSCAVLSRRWRNRKNERTLSSSKHKRDACARMGVYLCITGYQIYANLLLTVVFMSVLARCNKRPLYTIQKYQTIITRFRTKLPAGLINLQPIVGSNCGMTAASYITHLTSYIKFSLNTNTPTHSDMPRSPAQTKPGLRKKAAPIKWRCRR